MLARDNFAGALAMGTLWSSPGADLSAPQSAASAPTAQAAAQKTHQPPSADMPEQPPPALAFDPARVLIEQGVSRPEDVVDALLGLYIPGELRPLVRVKLVSFVAEGKPTGPALARRVREAVHAVLTLAEYQLA